MSQVTIRSIITVALDAWATSKGLPIATEGNGFEKPDNLGTFLELNIIPDDIYTATIDGSRKRYLGEVMINIWTDSSNGTGTAESLADELCNLFAPFPKTLLPVSVETFPSVKRAIVDDSGYRITPICFLYRMEA